MGLVHAVSTFDAFYTVESVYVSPFTMEITTGTHLARSLTSE